MVKVCDIICLGARRKVLDNNVAHYACVVQESSSINGIRVYHDAQQVHLEMPSQDHPQLPRQKMVSTQRPRSVMHPKSEGPHVAKKQADVILEIGTIQQILVCLE